MAVTTTSTRCSSRRQREIIQRRHPAQRAWTMHPLLDVAAATAAGLTIGGYLREWMPPPLVVIAVVTVMAVMLGVGWLACIAMLRRLRGIPVSGFARGFPPASVDALVRVAVESLGIAAFAAAIGVTGCFGWMTLPWALLLTDVVVLSLGFSRYVQIAATALRVVRRP